MSQSTTSPLDLKQTIRELAEKFNDPSRRPEYLDMHASDIVVYGIPENFSPDNAGLRQFYDVFWHAFPDVTATVEDMIAEGDRIAIRVRLRGTNEGEFMGMPATGKAVDLQSMGVLRFAGGKIVERWIVLDQMVLLQQLGAIPAVAPA